MSAVIIAATLAVALACCVVALYLYQFHGDLADSSQDWANFGDYLGGTLGPLFAFLAFALGLHTINQSRQQSRRDELLKTIQGYEHDFELCVAKPVTCQAPWVWGNDFGAADKVQEVPLRTLLQSDGIDWEQHLPIVAQGLKFRVLPDGELIQDRDIWLRAHLAAEGIFRYLELYKEAGGDMSLVQYLTEKYEIARNRLLSSGHEAQLLGA
ncbi:hypothetical protein UU9_13231 [Rhodanobacter fulvus Jip2]|uniref:Transmembrane protein n=1 Tax=Rhodanobacter fulvus Jip2 TaxID=1163408 RepID=I4VM13_9GAMM|nr:hypothetical protein [Rhodanobacter fulvus]EIL88254.1 hypothetical protein UU9_13231 [Rhodanobacter fulvus Jip2]